ncbi:M3 family oligoendopeptidase [Marinilactibacillus sp. XAAS-LB27]|uniref:M3 family oligoendopeptidase n=1 Tax=Marinilactibacillus sp. XAAS-LB27 TaxID=3114538 RepID=UPI002E176F19|nr:M3 family oligoendopeptidase [Marinilactibacillus sp. XAAS-LB27]
MSYPINWNMESVFEGESQSQALRDKIESMKKELRSYHEMIENWDADSDHPDYKELTSILSFSEKLGNGLSESMTYSRGLLSANVKDKLASKLTTELSTLYSEMSNSSTMLTKKFVSMSDSAWSSLLEIEPFKSSAFPLNEQRDQGKSLLAQDVETAISTLANDGFKGWGDLYNTLVASIEVELEDASGTVQKYSAGQAANIMGSAKDPDTRLNMLKKWEEAWSDKAPLFADTLNHLAGFRLENYKLHGTEDFMERPLEYNRLKKETLDTMWDTITKNKPKVVRYLKRKAQLMNIDQLSWVDVTAPVSVGDFEPRHYSFDEAATFIMENFSSFSEKMQSLAKTAFEDAWIEAEDRDAKRPGGYCANLPESEESRIFMTFSGSAGNVSTLAHELGHAFHSYVMRDLPSMNRRYAMNVAETASTFAELVISDATVREAKSEAEKINLLDSKNARAATMFMNIHSRYIFESAFYEERKTGIVTDDRLSELMVDAQKEAYQDSLSTYHPTFWASKLHFYNTGVPFYNFPYTFGFLFSLGIYARSLEEGTDFEDRYIALLRDTASMTTEELAQKHLNVDLTQPEFWQSAIDMVHSDIDEYLEITEKYI